MANTEFAIVGINLPVAVGNWDITSPGFGTPDVVLFFLSKATAWSSFTQEMGTLHGWLVTSDSQQYSGCVRAQDAVSTSKTSHSQSFLNCIHIHNLDGTLPVSVHDHVANITDGIRLNCNTFAGSPGSWHGHAIFMKGNIESANIWSKALGADTDGTQTITTGGGRPHLTFTNFTGSSPGEIINTSAHFSHGVILENPDGTFNQRCLTCCNTHGVSIGRNYSLPRNGAFAEKLVSATGDPFNRVIASAITDTGIQYSANSGNATTNVVNGLSIEFTDKPQLSCPIGVMNTGNTVDHVQAITFQPNIVMDFVSAARNGWGIAGDSGMQHRIAYFLPGDAAPSSISTANQNNQSTDKSMSTARLESFVTSGSAFQNTNVIDHSYDVPSANSTEYRFDENNNGPYFEFLTFGVIIGDVLEPVSSIRLGSNTPDDMRLGTLPVDKIMMGTTQVW